MSRMGNVLNITRKTFKEFHTFRPP